MRIRYGYMFRHLKKSFMPRKDFTKMATAVQSTMKKLVLSMVDTRAKAQTDIATLVAEAVKKERENLQAELSMQVTNDVANIVPSQDDEQARNADLSIWWSLKIKFEKPAPPIAPYDDEVPSEEVSPKLLEEISGEVDEAQLKKVVNDMLRESRKEDLSLQIPKKPTLVYQSCVRDPKAPPMTLLNQDLFYMKHGNSGPKKVLWLVKKMNMDVKHGYAAKLSDNDAEYLRFYEEYIKDRLRHQDQMRR
ncbi:hypothetical protein Tco_1235280 [Tanacetum coccineum]